MDKRENEPSDPSPEIPAERPRWILNTLAVLFLLITVAVCLYPSFIDVPDLCMLEHKEKRQSRLERERGVRPRPGRGLVF